MRPSRRQLIVGLGALSATGLIWRVTGYPAARGTILTGAELLVLDAAAHALLPPAPGPYDRVAANVDRFAAAFSLRTLREVTALLLVVEHGTLLSGHARRFTNLPLEARRAAITALGDLPELGPVLVRGLRDLLVLGYYQDSAHWDALGYEGPRPPAPLAADYEALRAAPGQRPRCLP